MTEIEKYRALAKSINDPDITYDALDRHATEAAYAITALCDRLEAAERDAKRYRYLRNRIPSEVLENEGLPAGIWIDCEDAMGCLQLLTGEDADAAIDTALSQTSKEG